MMQVYDLLSAWHAERNNTADDDLDTLDARYAADAGLPTLAALLALRDTLLRQPRGAAIAAHIGLDTLIHAARGEANARIQHMTGDDALSVPGLATAETAIESIAETPAMLAARMGAVGGSRKSGAKAAASRANGRKGGRPRKTEGK